MVKKNSKKDIKTNCDKATSKKPKKEEEEEPVPKCSYCSRPADYIIVWGKDDEEPLCRWH